jgi:hypothetical protein
MTHEEDDADFAAFAHAFMAAEREQAASHGQHAGAFRRRALSVPEAMVQLRDLGFVVLRAQQGGYSEAVALGQAAARLRAGVRANRRKVAAGQVRSSAAIASEFLALGNGRGGFKDPSLLPAAALPHDAACVLALSGGSLTKTPAGRGKGTVQQCVRDESSVGLSVDLHVDKDRLLEAEFAFVAGLQVEGEEGHMQEAPWTEAGGNGRSDVLVCPRSHLRVAELVGTGALLRPAAIKQAVAESRGRMVAARMCVGDCILMDADLVHGCEGGRNATRLYWRVKGDGKAAGKRKRAGA